MGKAVPYPPYIPQLKIDSTNPCWFSGNQSDNKPVARGLTPDSLIHKNSIYFYLNYSVCILN